MNIPFLAHSGLSPPSFSLQQAFRTRYFVLHVKDATLYYYESKAKRNIGVKPRNIPFLQFYNVTSLLDKNRKVTKRFRLRVMSGREFEFEAPSVENART